MSAKRCPGERLDGAGRGGVLFAVFGAQRPSFAQYRGKFRRPVAGNGQPGALLRPVGCEAAEDGNRVRHRCCVKRTQILALGPARGQEVQDRAIVPDPVGPLRLPGEDVGPKPMNLIGGRSEPSPGDVQSGRGDVEHRDVAKSAGEQGIDKDRRAAAHVDHTVIRRARGEADQAERQRQAIA